MMNRRASVVKNRICTQKKLFFLGLVAVLMVSCSGRNARPVIKRGRKGTNALQPTVGADPCVCPNNNEQAACPYIPKLVGRRPPPAPPKEGSNRVCPYAGCSTIVPFLPFLSPLRSESVSFVAERTPL